MKKTLALSLVLIFSSFASADMVQSDSAAIVAVLGEISSGGKTLAQKIEILNRFRTTFEASVNGDEIQRTSDQRTDAFQFISGMFADSNLTVDMFSTKAQCDRRVNVLNSDFEMPGMTQAELDNTDTYQFARRIISELCKGVRN